MSNSGSSSHRWDKALHHQRVLSAWGMHTDPDPDSGLKYMLCPGCEGWQVDVYAIVQSPTGRSVVLGIEEELDAAVELMDAHLVSCPEGAMLVGLRMQG